MTAPIQYDPKMLQQNGNAAPVLYDPKIIQKFANRLYRQAKIIIFLYSVLGMMIGAIAGYMMMWNSYWQWLSMAIGAILLGNVGYVVGSSRALILKLTAQTALCQMYIEQNTKPKVSIPTEVG